MKDEEIIALAKESELVEFTNLECTESEVTWIFGRDELVAFARAIADLQKDTDARICENEKVNYAATGDLGDLTYNTAIEHCINAIRSPETDLDEALRRQ